MTAVWGDCVKADAVEIMAVHVRNRGEVFIVLVCLPLVSYGLSEDRRCRASMQLNIDKM